ncbi:MAG: hypothetical protein AAGE52_04255 [Myxococcota bacterium]
MRTPLRALPLLLIMACGPAIPQRFVVERNIDDYAYRRYQHVLDVEFLVQENPAEGHTATYVDRRGRDVAFYTAFVTVYEKAAALTAEIRERLETVGTYDVEVVKREGDWMWSIQGGETWLLWVSGRHLVKLGSPAGVEVPGDLVDAYTDIFPSDLDDTGRAREGTESAGNIQDADDEDEDLDLPQSLREGSPR